MLEIVYHDESVIAINKPHDLLVHRSSIAKEETNFALQMLRDQINQKVYPVHRLDRKTGGILLFALQPDHLKTIQLQFAENKISKTYLAIVRGYTPDSGEIDYALKSEKGKIQEAVTRYETLDQCELDVPFGRHSSSRYSLVKIKPQTGRMHQIRKHMSHIFHPIIGDRPHGCNKQNKLFKEKWNMMTMLLHARELEFEHPITMEKIIVSAQIQSEFRRMMEMMGFELGFE